MLSRGLGVIQELHNAVGVGGGGWGGSVRFPRKIGYEDVWLNIISTRSGWVGVKFPGKKHYILCYTCMAPNVFIQNNYTN